MSGFLVEVRPGREVEYKSAWALRDAMRSGVISGDSRIFHRATSTWISITEHPEYRRFLLNHEPPAWMDASQEPAESAPEESERPRGLSYRFSVGFAALKRRLEAAKARLEAPPEPPPRAPSPQPKSPAPAPKARVEPEAPREPPQTPPPAQPPGSRRDSWTYFP